MPAISAAKLGMDLLFTDATYDIGKSGATRPRDGFFSRNLVVGGTGLFGGALTTQGALTGVTVTATTTVAADNAVVANPSHATYTGTAFRSLVSRAASSAFFHLYADSNGVQMAYIRGDGAAGFAGPVTSTSATGGIGYATGAGGAQTQATDKSTGVTSNTITTAITMNAASLAAATVVSFTFTNSSIAATDTVLVTHQSAGTSSAYTFNAFPGAGSAVISVRNNTAGALAEAIVLRVTVIKSVSA